MIRFHCPNDKSISLQCKQDMKPVVAVGVTMFDVSGYGQWSDGCSLLRLLSFQLSADIRRTGWWKEEVTDRGHVPRVLVSCGCADGSIAAAGGWRWCCSWCCEQSEWCIELVAVTSNNWVNTAGSVGPVGSTFNSDIWSHHIHLCVDRLSPARGNLIGYTYSRLTIDPFIHSTVDSAIWFCKHNDVCTTVIVIDLSDATDWSVNPFATTPAACMKTEWKNYNTVSAVGSVLMNWYCTLYATKLQNC